MPPMVVHCARRRIAAADQVGAIPVDMGVPVDLGFLVLAPALSCLRLVLHDLLMPAGDDEVGRLQHGLDAEREQMVEVDGAERVGADGDRLLQDHRTFVEAVIGTEDGEACLGVALDDRPVDRARAAVLRQQPRIWYWIMPCLGMLTKSCARNSAHRP